MPARLSLLLCFLMMPIIAAEKVSFNREIRPILSENCYYCHGPDDKHREEDLRLDIRAAAISAKAIIPGKPEESSLIERVFSDDEDDIMPPPKTHKVLTSAQKDILKRWIAEGAEYEEHWAFVAPKPQQIPKLTTDQAVSTNAIDTFIQKELEKAQAQRSALADPQTLIRRVTFDLTGLPPTLAEVDDFVKKCRDSQGSGNTISMKAYEAVVDRLLASPAYGEQMARTWLDYARYADSHGFQVDSSRSMWPWRDWVIKAFNDNMPFDQFTIEQLAGDLLPNPTNAQIVATGFHRNHRLNGEGGLIEEEWRVENIIDRVDTTGSTWLGLTLGCARCHDHKYDPISQKEFYQMFAFFNNIDETGNMLGAINRNGGNIAPIIRVGSKEQIKSIVELESRIALLTKSQQQLEKKISAEQAAWEKSNAAKSTVPPAMQKILAMDRKKRSKQQATQIAKYFREHAEHSGKEIGSQLAAVQKQLAEWNTSIPTTMVMKELPTPRKAYILNRGLYTERGEEVTASTPAALPPLPAGMKRDRLALAKWIFSPKNPLTARVWVNRQWERFFGNGIVGTSENFGMQSEPPSHPELLDWLALEFINKGWDMKAMQKLMVMSATYRQSSQMKSISPKLLEKDPYNRLLSRAARIRLPAESIRDQALAVSGLLDLTLGGPSVRPYMPERIWDETSVYGDLRNYKHNVDGGLYRRTLYTIWKRTAAPPSMLIFDSPSREMCTVKRSNTNTPLQALALLNEITYVEAARVFAQRMIAEGGKNPDQRIAWGFRQATLRSPSPEEMSILQNSFARHLATYKAAPLEAAKLIQIGESAVSKEDPIELAAYTLCANVILNLDEVITRD